MLEPREYGMSLKIEKGTDAWHMIHGTKQTYALQELKRFQMERELHLRPFDKRVCIMNIIEEIFEMYGVGDDKDRTFASAVTDAIEAHTELIKLYAPTKKRAELQNMDVVTYDEPTEYDEVDALCDIQVFAGGDVLKLGYDNERCLVETAKEINSREGEIFEGKFQKYKTPEAKALWYKADYSGCKL